MTSPDPVPADWVLFVTAVAEHQIRTERDSAFLRDPVEIEQNFTNLQAFHRALHSDRIPAEELAALAEKLSGPAFQGPGPAALAELRHNLARCPIRFTPVEPPATAILLSQSYARVSWLAFPRDTRSAFLLATDNRYRPHASVQQWAQDRYLILMGRYVLLDTSILSRVLARLIVEAGARSPGMAEPWAHPDFPPALLEVARANQWLHQQIAYGLCAAAEGERYRLAFIENTDPAQGVITEQVSNEIAAGALDFLIGHELSHVAQGHLQAGGRPAGESPWYASAVLDRVRPAEIVEEYLRRYWPVHSLESEADLDAVLWAAGDGETGAWDLRLMGAQLAITVISFLDRANHLLKFGRDPVDVVGLRNYGLPGLIDLVLPMPTHPWGKTRATAVNSAVPLLYRDFFDSAELRRKTHLMRAVADVFGTMGVQALQAIRWISRQPGEYVAMVLPDGRLLTMYWPPGFVVGRDEHEQILSTASRFYADIAPDLPTGEWVEEDYGRGSRSD